MYDRSFPFAEIKIKPKNLETPWYSKTLKKSSKTKQRPYINFLKNKSIYSEEKCKSYKSIFEKCKIKSRKSDYASLLNKYKYDSMQTWQVMKKITGKQKSESSSLSKTRKTKQRIIEKKAKLQKNLKNVSLM